MGATSFDPNAVPIQKWFTEVITCTGPIDEAFLIALKREYANRMVKMIS